MTDGMAQAGGWLTATVAAWIITIAGCDGSREGSSQHHERGAGGSSVPADRDPSSGTELHTIYVPAYGTVRTSKNNHAAFAITLSIRNVDPEASVTLGRVDYYDTPGHRVRSFLKERRVLRPLETVEFFVPADEQTRASGANFLIGWEGPPQARTLLAESIMISYSNGSYVTFTSRGIQLDAVPASEDLPATGGSAEAAASAQPSASP